MRRAVAVTTKSPSDVSIPLVSTDELLSELGRDGRRGALAFDGDGTLWSGDVGEDFFFGILDSGRVTNVATAEVKRIAASERIDAEGDAAAVARRIYDTYLRGSFDEERVCEIMTWICAGWSHAEATDFAVGIVDEAFRSRIHPEVNAVITGARTQGHEIFLVSASPRPIVEAAGAVAGIEAHHVLASTAVLEGDRFGTAVHRPIPYGAGKASALRKALSDLPLLASFGDNAFDVEMLAMAEKPVAVRPKPRLIERAVAIRGIRRLAHGA
jgi:phosphatidylglycerophosphatase C